MLSRELRSDGAFATAGFGVENLSDGASVHGGSLGAGGLFEDSGDGVSLEATAWARHQTMINAGEEDTVTVGVNNANRSVLARWSTDGSLIDSTHLAAGTGLLPASGYAYRVDLGL